MNTFTFTAHAPSTVTIAIPQRAACGLCPFDDDQSDPEDDAVGVAIRWEPGVGFVRVEKS